MFAEVGLGPFVTQSGNPYEDMNVSENRVEDVGSSSAYYW